MIELLRGLFEYLAPLGEVLVELKQRECSERPTLIGPIFLLTFFHVPWPVALVDTFSDFAFPRCSKEVLVVLSFLCLSRPASLPACHVVTALTLSFDYVVGALCLAMAQVAARPARPVLRSMGWFVSVLATCVALTCKGCANATFPSTAFAFTTKTFSERMYFAIAAFV